MKDYDNIEVKILLDDDAVVYAKEADYDRVMSLGKKAEEGDIEQEDKDAMIEFLKEHVQRCEGFTVRGKDANIDECDKWPFSLVIRMITGFNQAMQQLAGIKTDKAKKK
jgi:hypothetical protein